MSTSGLNREITAREKYDFHRDGAVLLKGVLASHWNALLEEGLEFVERERCVDGQRAHDRQADTLVDETIERHRRQCVAGDGFQGRCLVAWKVTG